MKSLVVNLNSPSSEPTVSVAKSHHISLRLVDIDTIQNMRRLANGNTGSSVHDSTVFGNNYSRMKDKWRFIWHDKHTVSF